MKYTLLATNRKNLKNLYNKHNNNTSIKVNDNTFIINKISEKNRNQKLNNGWLVRKLYIYINKYV